MSQYFYGSVGVGLDASGDWNSGAITIPASNAIFDWNGFGGDFNSFAVDQFTTTDDVRAVAGLTSAKDGHIRYYYPGYFTIDDPLGTHHPYPDAYGGSYPSISDYTVFVGGIAVIALNSFGHGPFGTDNSGTNGWQGGGSLILQFPENAILTGDITSGVTVASTTGGCGTSGYTFALKSGTLPPGLTLNSDGTITGTPTSSCSYDVVIQAEKSSSSAYCYGTIEFSGLFIVGSGGLKFGGSNIDDTSGIYTIVPGKTCDTLYTRFFNSKKDVKIPDPFIKTGYFGG